MGTTQRNEDGQRVRNGVVKTITGYAQAMRDGDDRTTKNGARLVKRSIRVPIKDHPKGGEYHQVQSLDERVCSQLAAMPDKAQVRVTGPAKVDRWVHPQTGETRTTEIVWAETVEVIALFSGFDANRNPAAPQRDEDW